MSSFVAAFLPAYFANILGPLSLNILNGLKFSDRRLLADPEADAALRRCLKAGLVAVARKASADTPEGHAELLKEILEAFFAGEHTGPAAGRELGKMLSNGSPNIGELREIFEYAGYDPETLPGLSFEAAIAHFQAAFREAAMAEAALQPFIRTQNQADRTEIQRETLAEIREMVALLRRADPGSVRVVDGVVAGEDRDTGAPMVLDRGVRIEGDALENMIATGDGNHLVRAVTYIQNQYNLVAPEGYLDPRVPPDNWESAYLIRLLNRCDPLDLAAVDETCSRDGREVRVSDVYTTLFLKGIGRRAEESVADAILNPPKAEETETRRAKSEEERVPIQAVEAIGGLDRVVILGQPGGGKSTLVNHVAARLARLRSGEPSAEPLNGWDSSERPLPVRVVLRDFAAWLGEPKGKGTEKDVWDFLETMLGEWGCSEFFPTLKRVLVYEDGVVFFDGLDEVGGSDGTGKRARLVAAIDAFSRSLPKCRTVVTCRKYVYQEKEEWRLPAERFPAVVLDEFHEAQIRAFLGSWFAVYGRQRDWSEKQAGDEADFLFQAIRDRPHLEELAPNPLLLTLMAIVHGASGLPENRADLYDRAVRLLLAHWENRIVRDAEGCRVEPSVIARLKIPVQSLRGPLERLAIAAHERQESDEKGREGMADIPMMDVLREFRSVLGSLDEAERVVSYIENRAGLLQGKGDGDTFLFPHRTFQEYLAATGILDLSDPDGYLSDAVRRDLPFWREVFLLAAGASRKKPKGIYDQLDALVPECVQGETATPEIARYARLAAQAIHETGFMDHVRRDAAGGRFRRIHDRVQQWLLAAMVADKALTP
ncbi:MAG: NACHT domain-containing protein, partial [Desulfococcaceae bacterium]